MEAVRGHNEGTIFRRARDGKFVAAVSIDGRRPTKACPHRHTPAELRGKECPESRDNLRELLRLRDLGADPAAHRLTVGQYLQRWLRDVRPSLAPATWRKHESICRVHATPALGHLRLSELSVGDVRHYLLVGARRLGAQSLRHHRATLRRALADALRDGLVTRNVAALAEAPKMSRKERSVLTAAQAKALIDGTRDDRLHALWVLALTTGLREAEMLGLTWEDVDLGEVHRGATSRAATTQDAWSMEGAVPERSPDRVGAVVGGAGGLATGGVSGSRADSAGVAPVGEPARPVRATPSASVTVRRTLHRCDGRCDQHECLDRWQLREPKTAKSRRTVPLPPVTVAALEGHRTRQRLEQAARGKLGVQGLVFTTPTGRPIHGSNLLPDWYAALARLGLPRVTLHDCRHTAATVLYGLGVPLPVISDILGHSTIRVTSDLYRHRVPELSDDAARRMQEALG